MRDVLRKAGAVAWLAALVAGSQASAQGITLPTPRVVGPSPEVKLLVQLTDQAEAWLPDSDPRIPGLRMVRYRLMLAPFRAHALETIRTNPSDDEIWAQLYADVLADGERAVILTARKQLAAKSKLRADSVAALIRFALCGPDSGHATDPLTVNLQRSMPLKGALDAVHLAALTHGDTVRALVQRLVSATAKDTTQCKPREVGEGEASFMPSLVPAEGDPLLAARLDSLARVALLVATERDVRRTWLPVRSTEQARAFWRQRGLSPLNLAALTGTKSAGAAYTELASPLLHAFRLSLSTVLSRSNDTTTNDGGSSSTSQSPADKAVTAQSQDAQLASFLNGGGQVNVGAALPLLATGTRSGSASMMALWAPRLGTTLGALGTIQPDPSAFVDPGVELHFSSIEMAESVGAFVQSRWGWAIGGSDFATGLGLPATNRSFGYVQTTAGLLFGGKYLLSGGRVLGGPSALRRLGWQIGVTVIRGPGS